MIDAKAYRDHVMKVEIEDKRKILDLQNDFNKAFPYLKIEFFSIAHKEGDGTAKKYMIANTKTLGECRKQHTNGSFTINSKMTVTELESRFNTIYGLSVQLFRKSGRAWLETTVTDGWTLEEQNNEGEALSK
jgi:hypothetical protein